MLDAVWDAANDDERAAIGAQIHKIHTELQNHRFDRIGGWIFDHPDNTTPVLGPFFEGYGPFNSEREWLQHKFDSQVLKATTNMALEALREYIPAATAIVKAYLSSMSECPVVLFHGDFAFRNMLVDHGVIVGILDWEWCGAMPMWKEWGDVSFGDRHVYDYVPSFVYPNPAELDSRQRLFQLIEAFSPWQMGCWPEKDATYAAGAKQTILATLDFFSSQDRL
ncbi:hypothetical protein H310_05563 [Aphanomyces invadans]|nr:hypothetical protein H310_05563 [Aphanomyces invadans]ETW03144.1 hypothetical protein H310_05563 [Aphanomyces invadans]|eukprot:XP_008868528.1 hypothetical protein H310_05563 [Aphanomyces invadans]